MKKQSWIKELIKKEGLAIAMVMVLMFVAFSIIYGIYHNSASYICSKSPEKCVCGEEGSYTEMSAFESDLPKIEKKLGQDWDCRYFKQKVKCNHCLKFRLKTQAELDIDDCNSNPREDEICKCEGYQDSERLAGIFNQIRLKEKNISIETFKYVTYSYMNNFRVECRNPPIQDCFIYEITTKDAFCLKSRPKTDYEKHPDYVAEIY